MQIENNPSFFMILQVWFSLTWRYLMWVLIFLVPALIAAIGLTIVVGIPFGFDKEAASTLGGMLGFIFGLAAALSAGYIGIKKTIGQTYSGYRLLFVKD